MDVLGEQDRRVAKAFLISLALVAAVLLPLLAMLLLGSCDRRAVSDAPADAAMRVAKPYP